MTSWENTKLKDLFICLLVYCDTGIEPKALHVLDKFTTTELYPQTLIFFSEIQSLNPPGWL